MFWLVLEIAIVVRGAFRKEAAEIESRETLRFYSAIFRRLDPPAAAVAHARLLSVHGRSAEAEEIVVKEIVELGAKCANHPYLLVVAGTFAFERKDYARAMLFLEAGIIFGARSAGALRRFAEALLRCSQRYEEAYLWSILSNSRHSSTRARILRAWALAELDFKDFAVSTLRPLRRAVKRRLTRRSRKVRDAARSDCELLVVVFERLGDAITALELREAAGRAAASFERRDLGVLGKPGQ